MTNKKSYHTGSEIGAWKLSEGGRVLFVVEGKMVIVHYYPDAKEGRMFIIVEGGRYSVPPAFETYPVSSLVNMAKQGSLKPWRGIQLQS